MHTHSSIMDTSNSEGNEQQSGTESNAILPEVSQDMEGVCSDDPGTSGPTPTAADTATALSLCAALHLQVVHTQAQFVAEEVQKLQYDAASPEALIASPSTDVTIKGPGGRDATDAEATLMSLLDASGMLSSPNSLQEAMVLMAKMKNASHRSYFLYILGHQTTLECQRQFVLNGGLRLMRLWLEEGVRETQIPLLKDIATVFRKLPFDVDAFMKSHIAISFKELKSLKDESLDRHVKEIKKFVQEQGGAASARNNTSAPVPEPSSSAMRPVPLDSIPHFVESKEAVERFQSQFAHAGQSSSDLSAKQPAAKPKVPLKLDIIRDDSSSSEVPPPSSVSPRQSLSGQLLSFASFSSNADNQSPATATESPSGDVGSPTHGTNAADEAKQTKGTKMRRKGFTFSTEAPVPTGPVLRGVLKMPSTAPTADSSESSDTNGSKPLLTIIDTGKGRAPPSKKKRIIWVDEIRSGMSLCSVKHFDPDGLMVKSSKKMDTSAEARREVENRRLDFMSSMPTMNRMSKFQPLRTWDLSKIMKPSAELVLESKPTMTCKDRQNARQQTVPETIYSTDDFIPADPATFQDLDGKNVHTSHTYAAYYDNDGELVSKTAVAEGHVPDRMRYNLGETFAIPARIPWRGENEQPGPNEVVDSIYVPTNASSNYEFNLDRMDGVFEPSQHVYANGGEESAEPEEEVDLSTFDNLPSCLVQCDPLLLLFLAQDISNFMTITVDQRGEAIDERKALLLSQAIEKFKKGGRPCTPSDIARIFSETVGDKAPPLPPLEEEVPPMISAPSPVYDIPAAPPGAPSWQQSHSHYAPDPYGMYGGAQRPAERFQPMPAASPYGYPGSVGNAPMPAKPSRGQPNVGITRRVCRFFTSPEGCRFAEKCMNIHPGGKRKFDDMYS